MVTAILAVLLLSSCGTDTPQTPDRTLPAQVSRLVAQAGPPQATWLEDGRVTNAELEAAFLAAVSCVEESGASVEAEHLGAGDFLISTTGESEADVEGKGAIADGCFRENFELTATVYAVLYGPTERDVADASNIFVECANDLGLSGSSYEEVRASYRVAAGAVSIAPCADMEAEHLREVTIRRAGD